MTKFVYSKNLLNYRFRDDHPFNQMRLLLTKSLLESLSLLHKEDIVAPRIATDEELMLIHQSEYIEAVKKQDEEN